MLSCSTKSTTILVLGLLLLLLLGTSFLGGDSSGTPTQMLKGGAVGTTHHSNYLSSQGRIVTGPLQPHGMVLEDIELFYMLPKGDHDDDTTKPKGLLIFFHGCQHTGGQDLFRLPEDRIVALAALKRGLAVLSPTSSDRDSGCWSEEDAELFRSTKVVDKWIKTTLSDLLVSKEERQALPRYGMGASSGGTVLFHMYSVLNFVSMVSYISGKNYSKKELSGPTSASGNKRMEKSEPKRLPATGFVYMPRDRNVDSHIQHFVLPKLEEAHPTVRPPAVKVWKVRPRPLTVDLCDALLPELGDRRCETILHNAAITKDTNLLDTETGEVIQTYRFGAWKTVMNNARLDADKENLSKEELSTPRTPGELSPLSFSGHSWLWSSFEEVIASCYAMHEMTSMYHDEVLDFLMTQGGEGLESSSGAARDSGKDDESRS